ncbi:3-hydroxyacyl-ACP dehydratase FabZ [Caballeronia sordidicola]|uniref:3-hydroxyacyl-ACP dehydratase FabZ n=1 Tax=Caballeronia sordidicola TaxID=196367 RepID=UPI000A3C9EE1|nr:3-hydroxyacyl-ACP dehydratase FabZ [Caballeronia sordidicola]
MHTVSASLEIRDILAFMPHRYPFSLVDRVLELVPAKRIKALKNVSISDPFLTGQFPRHPIMPAVLILEALAQAAALLTIAREPRNPESKQYYFLGIDNAHFKRVVEPGDQLILYVSAGRNMRGVWKFDAHAEVDGVVAAKAKLICSVTDVAV